MNEKEIIKSYIDLQKSKQRIYSELSDNKNVIKITSNTHCKASVFSVIRELINPITDLIIVDNKIDFNDIGIKCDYILLNKSQILRKGYTYDTVYVIVNDTFVIPSDICYNNLIEL